MSWRHAAPPQGLTGGGSGSNMMKGRGARGSYMIEEEELPMILSAQSIDGFLCPITQELMRDPVVTVGDGHSYERTAIAEWFGRGHKTSPATGSKLGTTNCVPNVALRKAIEDFLRQHAEFSRGEMAKEDEALALKIALDMAEERLMSFKGGGRGSHLLDMSSSSFVMSNEEGEVGGGAAAAAAAGGGGNSSTTTATNTPPPLPSFYYFSPSSAKPKPSTTTATTTSLASPSASSSYSASATTKDWPKEDDEEGVSTWLKERTKLGAESSEEYSKVLAEDGASTLYFLVDANYTREDLLQLGIKKPHVGSVLRAIQAYRNGKMEVNTGIHTSQRAIEWVRFVTQPSMLQQHAMALEEEEEDEYGSQEERIQTLSTALVGIEGNQPLSTSDALVIAAGGRAIDRGTHSDLDTCSVLIGVLRGWRDEAQVVLITLNAMHRLIEMRGEGPAAACRRRLGYLGACQAVCEVLRSWPADLSLQLAGLTAIFFLAREDVNQRRFVQAGAPEIVAEALRAFPVERDIQEAGCKAVWNLANDDWVESRLGAAGVCDLVVEALQRFPLDRDVSLFACRAIWNVSNDFENKWDLGRAGACAAVVGALRQYADDVEIQVAACAAVRSLAGWNDDNKRKLGEEGACELVAMALQAFPTNCDVQEAGCGAIRNLASRNHDNKGRLAAVNAEALLRSALQSMPREERVRAAAEAAQQQLEMRGP